MPTARRAIVPPPPVVALAAWLVPGLGYWLIGQRARGAAVAVSIVGLFVLGLLVGTVRVIEVPGYDDDGQRRMVTRIDPQGRPVLDDDARPVRQWVLAAAPTVELRDKPWSIPQVLTGPTFLAGAAASVWAARPGADGAPRASKSHARNHEIGTLYTAVAGMLNLLTIIDAAHRAARGAGK